MSSIGGAFSKIEGDSYSSKVFNYRVLPLTDLSDKSQHDYVNYPNQLQVGNHISVDVGGYTKDGIVTRVECDNVGTPIRIYFKSDVDNKIYSVHALEAADDDEQITANDMSPTVTNQTSVDPNVSNNISNLPIFEILSPAQYKRLKLNEDIDAENVSDELPEVKAVEYQTLLWDYWLGGEDNNYTISSNLIDNIALVVGCKVEELVVLTSVEESFDEFFNTLDQKEVKDDFTSYERDEKIFVLYRNSNNIKLLFTAYTEDMAAINDI